MHKFTRGESPVDLARLKRNYSNWESIAHSNEHAQLGDALYERQERYCAYCETQIESKRKGHIEHLERRSDTPARTFDWSNMFFSCNHHDSCGKFKDEFQPRMNFDPADIIDPSQEDPLDFFLYDLNGGISARDEAHKTRADETIRIFNLDQSPRLSNIRRGVAETVKSMLPYLNSEEDVTDFLNSLGNCDCISVYYSLLGRKMV